METVFFYTCGLRMSICSLLPSKYPSLLKEQSLALFPFNIGFYKIAPIRKGPTLSYLHVRYDFDIQGMYMHNNIKER